MCELTFTKGFGKGRFAKNTINRGIMLKMGITNGYSVNYYKKRHFSEQGQFRKKCYCKV